MARRARIDPVQLERFMRAMFTGIITALARSLRDTPLDVRDIAALMQLDAHGPMRVGDLAEALSMPLPAASRMVRGLVDGGLVERREDEADRRARVLSLSTDGKALVDRTSRERVSAALATAAANSDAAFQRVADVIADVMARGGRR